jgi:hypothetical protein
MTARTIFILLGIGAGVLLLLVLAALQLTGLLAVESHRGYEGAVWSRNADAIYYLERETRGIVTGMGWEFFSPPARVRVLSDTVTLRRLDRVDARDVALHRLDVTPHTDRFIPRYRSRIFGLLRSRIDPGPPLALSLAISVPVQPRSETWVYRAESTSGGMTGSGWHEGPATGITPGEAVLVNDRELMVVRGSEGYGKAIVAQDADGRIEILRSRPGFSLTDVALEALAQRSRRTSIERVRHFRETHAELVERYRAEGMRAGEASLAAYDTMQEMGLLPADPTVTARPARDPAPSEPIFKIPARYFEVGLFRDIAAAIAEPGTAVQTSTGDYLKYGDDDVGVRLRKWRREHDSFVVQIDGKRWRLTVARP